MRESHLDDAPTNAAGPRRCPRCEVTWRGADATACWCCGSPGVPDGVRRLVPDEPAA